MKAYGFPSLLARVIPGGIVLHIQCSRWHVFNPLLRMRS